MVVTVRVRCIVSCEYDWNWIENGNWNYWTMHPM
jgi:hypothetical protein